MCGFHLCKFLLFEFAGSEQRNNRNICESVLHASVENLLHDKGDEDHDNRMD